MAVAIVTWHIYTQCGTWYACLITIILCVLDLTVAFLNHIGISRYFNQVVGLHIKRYTNV